MRWILLKALILVLSDKQVLIIVDDECDSPALASLGTKSTIWVT